MISNDSCKCLTISLSSLRLKRCLCWFSLSISWVEWPQKHMYLAKLQLLRKLHFLKGRFSANGKLTFQSILRLPNSLDEFLLDAVRRLNLIRNDIWNHTENQRVISVNSTTPLLAAGQQTSLRSPKKQSWAVGPLLADQLWSSNHLHQFPVPSEACKTSKTNCSVIMCLLRTGIKQLTSN